MRLEDIGFYTLSDERAYNSSIKTPLWRAELLLTERCNFSCPYCRGLKAEQRGDLPFEEAKRTVQLWINEGLKNVRFSGGEPTLYKGLLELVGMCREGGVDHIAISTNGSANPDIYRQLVSAGVNDFSISLDGGCCAIGDVMSGGIKGSWNKVVENIKMLSEITYVSVGMVFNEQNVGDCLESVLFADNLGVKDIRVIPSAQYNEALKMLSALPSEVIEKHKILKYRIDNINNGRHVRGINVEGEYRCWLALDDMAVVKGYHYPCIIHLREGGEPIGKVGPNMRQERLDWVRRHEPKNDPICREMCLDVCVDFNCKACKTHCVEDTCNV